MLLWIKLSEGFEEAVLIVGSIILSSVILLALLLYRWVKRHLSPEGQKILKGAAVTLWLLFTLVFIYLYTFSWLSIVLMLVVLAAALLFYKLLIK